MKPEFTPQTEIVGRPRNRRYQLRLGPIIETVRFPRRSRVIMGLDEFGNFVYIPLPGLSFDARSLPHLHRRAEQLFDRATERNAFTTAKKRKTTISGVLTNRGVIRPEKVGGFGSKYERKKIRQIRRENELKRRLLAAGINEHQLFLLMHSAYHSQTLLEREAPIRSLSRHKRGGFVSKNEVRIIRKQRLRNQRLAFHGNIYRY